MREIIVIAHNVRSSHNIGSLLRTAEGMGVKTVYMTGYSPYPAKKNDPRPPHIREQAEKQIQKTALGAEISQNWLQSPALGQVIATLCKAGFQIVALEQSAESIRLPLFKPSQKIALIVGNEVEGLDPKIITSVDTVVEIPMLGQKESYNVVQATAIALYHCRFIAK